ncbi:MAG: DUF4905 domain-containing protein [Ignavibacteriae bacterium]|nr:DUF4905 domain-containing protein [Ignavibacteriota bacterium]
MKLKKSFSFSDKKQIWRLLIDNNDKLFVETRDIDEKEVFFHCFDLTKGKKIFKNFQMEEKYWIGIEAVKDNVILFHKFIKPDMPEHKQIIAVDIIERKTIWKNLDYSFLTILENKIYAFKQLFEGREFFALDYSTGEVIEELGRDVNVMNDIINKAREAENFSDYKYPESVNEYLDENTKSIIAKETENSVITGDIEVLQFEDILLFNYHSKVEGNWINNNFIAYSLDKNKILFAETINKNLNAYVPDSFFIYKNLVILLKNKNEIEVYILV